MGRTSASQKASGGSESREGLRPSNESSFRRPAGSNADGSPTLRNLIPWRDMEKKLAERLAAKAAAGELSGELEKDSTAVPSKPPPSIPPWMKTNDVEPAPDSGVRTSADGPEPARELTYSVYTVTELDARAQARPSRMSMAFAPAVAPRPSRWPDVGKSGLALARAWWTCIRTPKPRPRVMDVCRVPLTAFLTDLEGALRALPWRKLAIGAGIAVGSLVLLLFVVLTAAELTDDLKPGRSRSALTTETGAFGSPTTAIGSEVEPASEVKPMVGGTVAKPADPRPAVAEPAQIEIDDDDTPHAAKAAPKPAAAKPAAAASTKKPAASKKKAVELFVP